MKGHRIIFIDAARSYAIILALGAHALHVFGVPDAGPWIMNYPFFTTMATPMFIFMFGVMMEIVYSNRAIQSGVSGTDGRLLHRAYQCYLAGAFIAVAALLGGIVDLETFFSSLVSIERTRYESILIIYAGALLVMPFILRLRLRYGVKGLLGLLLVIAVTVHIVSFTKHLDLGYWGLFVNRFVGIGSDPDLSILSTFTFILLGMLAGKYVIEGNTLYLFAGVAGSVCMIASLLIWQVTSVETFKALLSDYANRNLRNSGNIVFFLMGSFYSLAALCVIKFIVERFPHTHGLVLVLSPLGMNSLLAFTFGNSVLNLWHVMGKGIVPPSLSILLFFFFVWAVCKYTDRVPTYGFWYKLMNPEILSRYRPNNQSEAA
ncbi:MAG: OpgC domain-containing protein [Marinobacter sp.]